MNIPTRLNYNEAILSPRTRLRLTNPELVEGNVEMRTGSIPGPFGLEGGFAIVYKFMTKSQQLRALRCFKTQVPADMQQRYERIGSYFKTCAPGVTADFHYHEMGISVRFANGETVYPIIDMEWIEGVDLIHHVDELCRKRDAIGLANLSASWLVLMQMLSKARIAHSDLAGGNVMVRPDGRLVLVDYDGVYIPDLAGMNHTTLGQRDYQHPDIIQRRVNRGFDEHMDAFSAIVIYAALAALCVKPALWDEYTERDSKGRLLNENMLFKQEDFSEPDNSKLFKELEQLGDAHVREIVRVLKRACGQPITQIMVPERLFGELTASMTVYNRFVEALDSDDDERIIEVYDPVLDTCLSINNNQRARVDLARTRIDRLRRFRLALWRNKDTEIINAYDPILEPKLTEHERKCVDVARKTVELLNHIRSAIRSSDDTRLLQIILLAQNLDRATRYLAMEELQHVQIVQQRVEKLAQLRNALEADDDQKIVAVYDPIFNNRLDGATKDRISLAQRRQTALDNLKRALYTEDDQKIVGAYDPVLNGYTMVTSEERQRYGIARQRVDMRNRSTILRSFQFDADVALTELPQQIRNRMADLVGKRIELILVFSKDETRSKMVIQMLREYHIAFDKDTAMRSYRFLNYAGITSRTIKIEVFVRDK